MEIDGDQFMRLDDIAIKSLDLFEVNGDHAASDTLCGLLNKCRTAPGKRLLKRWIKQPLLDIHKINERLDTVESLLADHESAQSISTILNRFPDLEMIVKNFQKDRASLQDLYKAYQCAKLVPNTVAALKKLTGEIAKSVGKCLIEPIEALQPELSKLINLVVTSLDLDNMKNFEIFIKPNHDPELSSLKEEMTRIEKRLEKELDKAAEMLGLEAGKSIKMEAPAQWGYCFRVSNKDEKAIRNKRSISVLDSRKGGVKFRTEKLTELNDQYAELKQRYGKIQEKIVEEVLKAAAVYIDSLQRLCEIMSMLDVLLAFATVSRTYSRPEILDADAGILELIDARHPCLEIRDNWSFIPNNIRFEKGKTEFLLITGPNMGGKSTYLRQTGLIVLMAQIGCFVPCSSAKLSVVDAIFTRVGASDAQLEGASTFRVEMMEVAAILKGATSNSLILIDELGRGTSTYDGCALAWSIAEHIATNIHGWCMFATHFHELTALDIEIPTVHNLHVTADVQDGQFTLLYQVKEGPCTSSFGIRIAEILGLPDTVIQDANRVLHEFAWSQCDSGSCENPEKAASSSIPKTDSSATGFITQLERMAKNDRLYPSMKEKALALRNLMMTNRGEFGDDPCVQSVVRMG